MDQQVHMVIKHFSGVKAKNLKPKDSIWLGGRTVTVVETKKNAFGQIHISFKSWAGGQTYGVIIVDKNFPFNPKRTSRPKRK